MDLRADWASLTILTVLYNFQFLGLVVHHVYDGIPNHRYDQIVNDRRADHRVDRDVCLPYRTRSRTDCRQIRFILPLHCGDALQPYTLDFDRHFNG